MSKEIATSIVCIDNRNKYLLEPGVAMVRLVVQVYMYNLVTGHRYRLK